MSSRAWDWLHGSLIGLARVAMRVCWLYPCIELAGYALLRLDQPLIPLWLMGLILLVGWAVALQIVHGQPAPGRMVRSRDRETVPPRQQLFVAGLGLGLLLWLVWWRLYRPAFPLWDKRWVEHLARDLTTLGGMLRPLTLTLTGAYLWWRGLADGRTRPGHETTFRSFSVGFSWLVAVSLLSHHWPVLRPPSLWPAALAFVVCTLTTLALVDLDEVRRRSGLRAGKGPYAATVNRYWLLTLLTTIGLITGLGLSLTYLAAPSRIAALLEALTPLLDFLAELVISVIYYMVLAVSYLLFLILTPLMRVLNRLLRLSMPELGREPPREEFAPQFEQSEGQRVQLPPWLDMTARAMFLILLVGGIGLLFALALRRYSRRDEEGVEETRELIWSAETMREEWHALIQKLRRRSRGMTGARSPFLPLLGLGPDRRAIREVYRQLLAWAADRGLPRPAGATPYEFVSLLSDHYTAPEWGTITEAYVRARYTVDPLPAEMAGQVQTDWLRLSRRWEKEEAGVQNTDG